MPDHRSKLWWLTHLAAPLLILSASGVAFFALGERPEPKRKDTVRPQALLVETVPVESLGDVLTLEATGEVVPHREIEVSTEVGGRVLRTSPRLRVGEFILRGELLLEIDPARLELEMARLTTMRDQAQSDLAQVDIDEKNLSGLIELARESHRLSALDRKRAEDLLVQNVTSDAEVNLARKAELTARDTLQRMENELGDIDARRTRFTLARNLAAIQLQQAELDRDRAVIEAPVSGIVIAAPVEDHAVLQTGQQIVVIEDTSRAEVHCHLTLDEMSWVWNHADREEPLQDSPDTSPAPFRSGQTGSGPFAAGTAPTLLQTAEHEFPLLDHRTRSADADQKLATPSIPLIPADVVFEVDGDEFQWTGTLARIDGAGLDVESRTVPCRVVVDRPRRDTSRTGGPPFLMRGMFVSCRIRTRPQRALLTVPEIGVRPGNEVWLMRDGRLQVEPVRIVRVSDGVAVIDSVAGTVQPGERLITTPVPGARDGLPVTEADKGSRKGAKTQRGGE